MTPLERIRAAAGGAELNSVADQLAPTSDPALIKAFAQRCKQLAKERKGG